ncbi:PD-(D/E)XK nuclease-like domain-containing protein [Xenorhabdus bovienii]|uniref:PD-(D/E)XK nuclease-like domain-containing protein n=1 Tax=Xenorhabdus bovienii TaxID=40576 RepID=A0AAJ1MZW5_XENBV|nr:PD-(D/E)XK nuclease-like domain-containing protein [Xenorhabdus bovienii]MDE1479349.1 PD-(D/E)XK nuclease-like domain-containing protein [Xenorhabdus bovienii]MDE9511028.1 PD-(D/E)XK nuclease-like domain-containing protein [Xenorhabdus bovienii]MDE9522685.1 PD-(D/E)XK nuclease-like domain-containing protein [Xenorhabdus bovienii]
MTPGIYYDISNEDYHQGEGVSKSQLDIIDQAPAELIWQRNAPIDEEKIKSLDMGTALHCLLLEPDEFNNRFIEAPLFNRKTNAGKQEEKEFLEQCADIKKIIMDHEQHRKLKIMRDSALAHPIAKWFLEADGQSEISIYWNDSETDVLCRSRPDKLITTTDQHWIVDVKTSADMDRLDKTFYDYRYHVQDAFYSDGYKELTGQLPTFVFLVVSTTINCGRYPVRPFIMDEQAKSAGRNAYQKNLETYAQCLKTDEWPGIRTLSLPYWAKDSE